MGPVGVPRPLLVDLMVQRLDDGVQLLDSAALLDDRQEGLGGGRHVAALGGSEGGEKKSPGVYSKRRPRISEATPCATGQHSEQPRPGVTMAKSAVTRLDRAGLPG